MSRIPPLSPGARSNNHDRPTTKEERAAEQRKRQEEQRRRLQNETRGNIRSLSIEGAGKILDVDA